MWNKLFSVSCLLQFSIVGGFLSPMFSRLVTVGFKRIPAITSPVYNTGLQAASLLAPQRSFGVFSSIRNNMSEKLEEKKQKNQGLAFHKGYNLIDKGFKEMMEKLISYDTYGMKEYKEVFIVEFIASLLIL